MNGTATENESISDYIEDYRNLEISFETMHLKELNQMDDQTLILINDSVLSKYKTDFDEILISKTLTPSEENRYYCNPWLLSYDLYGSVEYWHLLLEANNMYSITEFTRSTINVYDSTLPDVVSAILALEEETINTNMDEIDLTDKQSFEDEE